MLCSHRKRFIYLKTKKTAGTSVEIFFEKYCLPEGAYEESHGITETITEAGIIGSRRDGKRASDHFYNHMPAKEVLAKLGPEIFNSYLKFCVIRNPYDKMVSRFWWRLSNTSDSLSIQELQSASFYSIRQMFSSFVRTIRNDLPDDRKIYMIDGHPIADTFIRFENLSEDIDSICGRLGIPFFPGVLKTYKSGPRVRNEHFSEYYDSQTSDLIARKFDWEIEHFSYRLR